MTVSRARWTLYALGALIAVALAVMARLDLDRHSALIFGLIVAAGGAYAGAMLLLTRFTFRNAGLVVCLTVAAVGRIALITAPVNLSSDVYRYMWEGRLQRYGYNPYVYAPDDERVAHVRTRTTDLVNAPQLPTPYPPVAQLFFRLVASVNESVVAFRVVFLACDALIVWLLWLWLPVIRTDPTWVLAYAWNPLVILENADGAHVDVLGVMFLMLAIVGLARRRTAAAAVMFGLAVGVKLLPAVAAPLFLGRVRPRDVAISAGVLALAYVPFIAGHGVPIGSLLTYLQQWRFNGPLFRILVSSLGPTRTTFLAVAAGFAVAAAFRLRGADPDAAAFAWPMAVTVAMAPAVFPWYLLWLAPFLVVRANLPLAAWTIGAALIYSAWQAWTTAPLPRVIEAIEYGMVAAGVVVACLMQYRARRSALAATA